LAEEGIPLTQAEYVEKYLAMDDRGCFDAVFKANGKPLTPFRARSRLIAKKTALYQKTAAQNLVILPAWWSSSWRSLKSFPLAMASGALRDEVSA
jgi:hypothetical protein